MTRRTKIPNVSNGRVTRCAIYTRKSTEEGLQQEFNSLDAQREAAEAYIASQKAEGWVVLVAEPVAAPRPQPRRQSDSNEPWFSIDMDRWREMMGRMHRRNDY